MNWGYKILTVYLLFMAGILFMVFRSSGEKTDLVTSDYYAQELKYQEKIDQARRVEALSSSLQHEIKGDRLIVRFPSDFTGKRITGTITLYCPADEHFDVRQPFDVTDTIVGLVLPKGKFRSFDLKVNWQSEGLTYYYEKKILI